MIKIGIADKHAAVLVGLKAFFAKHHDIVINEQLADSESLRNFLENSDIDVLIIDNENMGLAHQTDFKKCVEDFPDIKFVVYSNHQESTHAIGLLKCGAKGFVEKTAALDMLEYAIVRINGGLLGFSNMILNKYGRSKIASKDNVLFKKLSKRETEILRHFCDGHRNKHIAQSLSLDEKTISTYKTRLQAKMHVTNLVDLVFFAKKHQIV